MLYEIIKINREYNREDFVSVKGALEIAKDIYHETFYKYITRKDYIEIRKELNINSPCKNAISEFYIIELFEKYYRKNRIYGD